MKQIFLKAFLWLLALICLSIGGYSAFNHSYQQLLTYNYSIAPLGDQTHDMAQVIYPIITGEKPWYLIFQPFADHRVVVERLLIMYDFLAHQGLEYAHAYRIVFVFWLIFTLFTVVILSIKKLPMASKLLITGCAAALTFAGVSVSNFFLTICFTWPLVILFSLISFISVSYYCYLNDNQSTYSLFFLVLTSFFVILTIFTFNIGLILWPIIFLVLYKRQQLRKHLLLWIGVATLGYLAYFWSGWHPGITATDHGMKNSLLNPIHPFLYMSRIISIPLIASAPFKANAGAILLGTFISLLSIIFLIRYLKMKKWSGTDTILFSFLLFCFLSLIIIAMMRAWITGEYAEIGGRFVTSSLMLWLCLLASIYIFHYRNEKRSIEVSCILSAVVTLWLTIFFIPSDKNVYDASIANQHAIALSLEIPINKAFIDYSKTYGNGDDDSENHAYIDRINKKFQKGIYSFWPAQQIGNNIKKLSLSMPSNCPANYILIKKKTDLRDNGNPAFFLTSQMLENSLPNFDLIFTDQTGKIVGYSLPLANTSKKLWDLIANKKKPITSTWQGVINTSLIQGNVIQSWFVDIKQGVICKNTNFKI